MTKMKTLELKPTPTITLDNHIRFNLQLIRKSNGNTQSISELWYEIPKESNISWKNEDVEPYLIATILQAMHEERRIVAKGIASAELLSNLTEFCDSWNNCLPELFKKIDIECENIETDEHIRPVNKVLSAFSGGLDSTFLVWRHIKKQAGYRTQPLSCGVMIHGIDISPSNDEFFNMSFSIAQKTLETVGLPLIPIRTNIREALTIPIRYSQMILLVSALQFLKSKFGIALVGSAEPYCGLVIPWGSSPLTDHLLSSNRLKVLHDGAGYSRPEKAKCIASWTEGIANLRVCRHPDYIRSLNCGRCEKCLRTMACFAANGLPIPKSLNGNLEVLNARIKFLKLHDPAQGAEWRNLMKTARQNKIHDRWVKWVPSLLLQLKMRQKGKRIKGYLNSKFGGQPLETW
jgi:hypothetical protein